MCDSAQLLSGIAFSSTKPKKAIQSIAPEATWESRSLIPEPCGKCMILRGFYQWLHSPTRDPASSSNHCLGNTFGKVDHLIQRLAAKARFCMVCVGDCIFRHNLQKAARTNALRAILEQ
jgi:hypothetical protein